MSGSSFSDPIPHTDKITQRLLRSGMPSTLKTARRQRTMLLAISGVVAMRFLSLRIALAASILWSTYPFHLWLTKQPDVSAIFSTLLLLGVFLFLLWSTDGCHAVLYGFLLGFILAIIALIKPFGIALPAVFMGLAWMCTAPCRPRHRGRFSFCVLVAYLLLISPWEVWAWRVSGHWIPLCTNGPNALIDGLP